MPYGAALVGYLRGCYLQLTKVSRSGAGHWMELVQKHTDDGMGWTADRVVWFALTIN